MTITPEGLVTLAEAMGKEVEPNNDLHPKYRHQVWVKSKIPIPARFKPHKDADQCNECEEWALSNLNYRLEVTRHLNEGGWYVSLWEYGDEMRECMKCMSNISWNIGSTLLEAKTSCFIRLAESLKENSNE